jgi:hypothetical protein
MEYTIERISPKHYKDMQFLFRHCFKRSVSIDFFKKKFDTGRFGADHIGFIAHTEDGFPAAFYGVYPCRISYNGQTYLAAISGDSMTHSDHRGNHFFEKLSAKTFQLGKECGVKFMYGFPNQYSLGASIKSGWQYANEKMRTYTIKVSTLPLAKLCRKNSVLNSLYKGYVNLILKFYKSAVSFFPNSMLAKNVGGVLHDADYFSYKSYSHKKIIKIDNCNVWIKVDGELKIGDIEKKKEVDFIRLMKKLKFISFLIGCREIQTTVCEESFIHQSMKENFKSTESFMVARIDFGLDFPKENVKFIMADFDTF